LGQKPEEVFKRTAQHKMQGVYRGIPSKRVEGDNKKASPREYETIFCVSGGQQVLGRRESHKPKPSRKELFF
jgi:hypothetical protein